MNRVLDLILLLTRPPAKELLLRFNGSSMTASSTFSRAFIGVVILMALIRVSLGLPTTGGH